jgi:hypothetical protein
MTIEEYKDFPDKMLAREIDVINAKILELDHEKAKAVVAFMEMQEKEK